MPDHGPGQHREAFGGDEPLYAFYFATIRVQIDPREEAVTDVLVDEGTMASPVLVARADGIAVIGAERGRVEAILSTSEWPSWDYGSARHGPPSPDRASTGP
jgi:hypothetical protein